MFEFLNDIGKYDNRKVNFTEAKDNNGIEVSTVYTSDEEYETALIDNNGVHPVERYENKDDAELGHYKWVGISNKINTVTKLGWLGVTNNEKIILERIK